MVAGSFLFFAPFWLEIASTRGILLEFLSLQKSSFGSAFGSLIGTDLIITKIYPFANTKREEFAERLHLLNFYGKRILIIDFNTFLKSLVLRPLSENEALFNCRKIICRKLHPYRSLWDRCMDWGLLQRAEAVVSRYG